MDNNEGFNYTYSAKEQEEIKTIRKKYAASEEAEDKMTQLRRLDASVYSKASAAALVVGIVGALIMGIYEPCYDRYWCGAWYGSGNGYWNRHWCYWHRPGVSCISHLQPYSQKRA